MVLTLASLGRQLLRRPKRWRLGMASIHCLLFFLKTSENRKENRKGSKTEKAPGALELSLEAIGDHAKDLLWQSQSRERSEAGEDHVGQGHGSSSWPQSIAIVLPPLYPTAGQSDAVHLQKNVRKEINCLSF